MSKYDWAKVPQKVKDTKLKNRKSKRDIARELKIEELGGDPLKVIYGQPLEESTRKDRSEMLWDLMYPNRFYAKPKKPRSKTDRRDTLAAAVRENLRGTKVRSRKKGIPFNLNFKDLHIPEKCPVLGEAFNFNGPVNDWSPTLDRLNPEKGYVQDNVRLISMKANRIKNNGSREDLRKVLDYMVSEGIY